MLDHRNMFAVRTIRETLGRTIHEANDVIAARYEELRRERPDDFAVGAEECGQGLYP